MAPPLQEICNEFSKQHHIYLNRNQKDTAYGEHGLYFIKYYEDKNSESLSIERRGEFYLEALADGKQNILITGIAYGCLCDYVALLSRSQDIYARFIGKKYQNNLLLLQKAHVPQDLQEPMDFMVEEFRLISSRLINVLESVFPSIAK